MSKLRAKKVEKLRNSHKTASKQMTAYRKFRKWNIGFRNRERLFPVLPIVKKKKWRPTAPRFFWHVTVNTHIIFFGLSKGNEQFSINRMPYKWQLRSMFVIRHCITITWNINECGVKLLYINLEILKKIMLVILR